MATEQPRDDHGRFASGGGGEHTSGARKQARRASKAANRASEGATTQGDHQQAADAHKEAAAAHQQAADAHRQAADKASAGEKGEHQAQAAAHDKAAGEHDSRAEGHAQEAKSAPREKGAAAWVAKRVEGLTKGLEHAKESVEEHGEKAQELEEQALHGDPVEQAEGMGLAEAALAKGRSGGGEGRHEERGEGGGEE